MSDMIKKQLQVKDLDTVSELSKNQLVRAKIDLVRTYPFLGFLVMSTQYHFTDTIPTMAATTIGGNAVFINEKFISTILKNGKERAFVIAHEILHIFLEHIGRQQEMTYNPKLWNVATDYCINSYLVEMKSDMLSMPEMGLYDARFKDMSSDEIYSKLLQENQNDPNKASSKHGGDEVGNDPADGSGNGSGKRPFDEVSDETVSDAAKAENKQKLAAAVGQTNEESVKQMGSGAAALYRQFKNLIESKIPWNYLLREFITETCKTKYTYNRISRRSSGRILFPAMTGDHINLVFGVDTSGSMSDKDLNDAMSELAAIIANFESWHITLLSCDTDAHVIGEYDSQDGDEFDTIDKKLIGGGGTDMNPMVEYANDMEDAPAVIVILTDGFIPPVTTMEEIPVIIVVTRDGNKELESECALIKMEK